ncbi:hypothetical protein JHD45_21930 [Marinomonas spartinae]|nr:hypothetical protein [Marinomonas spartinae]
MKKHIPYIKRRRLTVGYSRSSESSSLLGKCYAVAVIDLLKDPRWRRVIAVAKGVYTEFKVST